MVMKIRKASREQSAMKVWLFWPSWSWKTKSALLLAYWITWDWSKIIVIDTENWSSDLYDNLWDFQVLELVAPFSPERYIEAINTCEEAWAEVIIIDSISHEWEGEGWIIWLADNSSKKWMQVWSELTPRHNAFIQKVLHSKVNIISCGRTKQDYVMNEVEKNWKKYQIPEKVWMKVITKDGFDYEMTICFDIDINHIARASKDRSELFVNKEFIITSDTWKEIYEWNKLWKKPLPETQIENSKNELKELNKINTQIKLDNYSDKLKEKISENKSYINKWQLEEIWNTIKDKRNIFSLEKETKKELKETK